VAIKVKIPQQRNQRKATGRLNASHPLIKVVLICFVAAVLIGVGIFIYYYVKYDHIVEARINSYSGKREGDMRETVWKKAKQLELPLNSSEDIKVQRNGSTVAISTQYTVHIDAPFHPFDLNFTPATQNKSAY